ncbi:hypothetical protein Nepgr_004970 [Nepenthes gracilis]|uniref:Uncharacterized protein n=1 Tax=Nepenthes gracilis TaxID=150966 RepID=A0AAD3S2F3_NEPGR|nr:hypothetical protein Nepgr_004970 [Nepenthes gracilis]
MKAVVKAKHEAHRRNNANDETLSLIPECNAFILQSICLYVERIAFSKTPEKIIRSLNRGVLRLGRSKSVDNFTGIRVICSGFDDQRRQICGLKQIKLKIKGFQRKERSFCPSKPEMRMLKYYLKIWNTRKLMNKVEWMQMSSLQKPLCL